MRKLYDDFIQQKPKEMSKTMEDMAFKYINPETQKPTKIPAAHFEKELGQEMERTISQGISRKFLAIMFEQLNLLKKEDERLFYQALICIDNGINPKDLRISEQIAINHIYEYVQEKQRVEKKEFHFFNQDISNEFKRALSDPDIQAEAVELSNFLENQESRELNRISEEQPTANLDNDNLDISNEESEEDIEHDYY